MRSAGEDAAADGVDVCGEKELRAKMQRLRGKLRSERETVATLSTQIETKKALLHGKASEAEQLGKVLQTKDERIAQLHQDKLQQLTMQQSHDNV